MKILGLDHVGIAVPSTEQALTFWRDRLGMIVRHQEIVNDGTTRLTHLSSGGGEVQLVEPMTPDHPLVAWMAKHVRVRTTSVSRRLQERIR